MALKCLQRETRSWIFMLLVSQEILNLLLCNNLHTFKLDKIYVCRNDNIVNGWYDNLYLFNLSVKNSWRSFVICESFTTVLLWPLFSRTPSFQAPLWKFVLKTWKWIKMNKNIERSITKKQSETSECACFFNQILLEL